MQLVWNRQTKETLERVTVDFLSLEYGFRDLIQIGKLFRKNLLKFSQKCNRYFVTDFRAKSVVKILTGRKIWYQITTALSTLQSAHFLLL